jgi:hypothetical protein
MEQPLISKTNQQKLLVKSEKKESLSKILFFLSPVEGVGWGVFWTEFREI